MMYRINEINAEYTKLVNQYIMCGYIIRPNGMSSCYTNEVCHIDFVDPADKYKLIRLWMAKHSGLFNDEFHCMSTLTIFVKQYVINPEYDHESLWMGDGIQLYSKKFYCIDEYKKVYETNDEIVKSISELRTKRYMQRPYKGSYSKHIDVTKLSDKFVKRIVDRIHENYGCKRAKADSIKEVVLNLNSNKLIARIDWRFNTRSGSIVLQ